MPTDTPSIAQFIEAVSEFLEKEIQPAVEGRIAFTARIALNVLGIVKRELELGPDFLTGEQDRLRGILGQDGSAEDLNTLLCKKIRDGSINYQDGALIDHLRRTTLGKMSIDNPKYSGYLRALRLKSGQGSEGRVV